MRMFGTLIACAIGGYIFGLAGWSMEGRIVSSLALAIAVVFVFKPWKEKA